MKRDVIVLSILLTLLIAGSAFLSYKAYQYGQTEPKREAEKSRVMFAKQARECALAYPLGFTTQPRCGSDVRNGDQS